MGLVSDPQVSALSSLVGSSILKPQTTPGFLAVGPTLWVRGVPTMAHGQKANEGVCSLFLHGQPFSHARVAGRGYFSKEAVRERGVPAEHGGGEKKQVEPAFLAAALATAEEQWRPATQACCNGGKPACQASCSRFSHAMHRAGCLPAPSGLPLPGLGFGTARHPFQACQKCHADSQA